MQLEIKQTGLVQLKQKLSKLDAKVAKKTARSAVRKAAGEVRKEIKTEAKKKFRQRSGTLVKSISARVATRKDGAGPGVIAYKVGVKSDAFYWRFLEFGTSRMPAKPFIRPGFEASKRRAMARMLDELREALK